MEHAQILACVDLIARAMDADEARFALATFRFHFECQRHGIHDGRHLFVCDAGGAPQGVVGLHFYHWGPPQNVWLSWFAVDPALHGTGLGSRLLNEVRGLARKLGYERLFIETYSGPVFERAVRFYQRNGFRQAGSIEGYLPSGANMLVFSCRVAGGGEDATERATGLAD